MTDTTTPRARDAVAMEDLRDQYVLCRTVLHAWGEFIDEALPRPEIRGWWWFVLRCERCNTRRYDLIDSNGDVFSRRYRYPDGYEVDEKITRSEIRTEWARRRQYEGFVVRRKKGKR